MLLIGAASAGADQKGAEKVKTPVTAKVVDVREVKDYGGDPIGNVQVVYKDGSKDQWTLKANASSPKVSGEGVVGWVLSPLQKGGKKLALYKNSPTFPQLRLVQSGKVLATIDAERPYIEEWVFEKGGKTIVIKSRGPHGPAFLQRIRVSDGKQIGSSPDFGEELPDWAKPFESSPWDGGG